jgi:DeoR family transcriptional regulator of aga operon
MSRQDRLSQILDVMADRGSIDVDEIASLLEVSAATIRRDLDTLAKRQLVTRTHGGAVLTGSSIGLPLTYKVAKEDEVKLRIAQAAIKYIERYQVIGFNGGTTTSEVARAIAGDSKIAPADENIPALTVVTNAVNIAAELTVRKQIKIVVTGGVARPNSYELTGPLAEEVLKEVNIDIAFLGVEAIDLKWGASAVHEDEARVNRQIAARASKVIVVTSSIKFEKKAFAVIRPIEEIDVLITDKGLDPRIEKQLIDRGIEVVTV